MITSALEGKLDDQEFKKEPFFGLYIPKNCPNVPDEVLDPKQTWKDAKAYDKKAEKLASSFHENFQKFSDYANEEIMKGSPDAGK